MFVELCLVLRMVLYEGDVVWRNISVVPCEATPDPQKDVPQKSIIHNQKEDSISSTENVNAHLKDLWVYKPVAHESREASEHGSRPMELRQPHSVTKLAKTIADGFDPYFSKGYFEPFERRPKLVTLVAFRKNGLIPRKTAKNLEVKSSEVAELQSPFNHINNFWMDAPAENLA